jgi:hypothetical protein
MDEEASKRHGIYFAASFSLIKRTAVSVYQRRVQLPSSYGRL